ncbi:putative peptide/nitrate transporter [Venturia nashicola]|uniref:Putative peptide/nitrate transporter n=1 Tax=Venturia nashicola TaxID=86259 RepID=A0A4Z1P0L7_9PEZI|nr:putative peptide/nitrate transporter [Venturia nashicola]TLD32410.1 putative peptide/nitrate transporter [Venturia nashicola]
MPGTIQSLSETTTPEETTPLLASASNYTTSQADEADIVGNIDTTSTDEDDEGLPLDFQQIFWVCFARIADPIGMFCIFPFVPSMVRSMSIPEEEVGFYTGLIESTFSLVQMCTMIFWGRLADRHGRKPVLVICSAGISVFVFLFGMSRTIWQMILCRCMAGLFSGSVVAIRSMVSELSTKKTQARAYSYFAFASNLGIFFGPLVGALASPAKNYPKLFGSIKFFEVWPYILPTAVAGSICAMTCLATIFFVKETLKDETISEESTRDNEDRKPKAELLSAWQIINSPGVPMAIFVFCYAGCLGFAFTAVAPVFWFTSVTNGGFGFAPNMISLFFMISGFSQALWLLLVFPPLQRRIGTSSVLRLCGVWWPIFFMAMPLGNFLLKKEWIAAFWAVSIPFQVGGSGVSMAFTGVTLALNDVTPGHQNLGGLNSIALTFSSAIRSITPALFSSLYAYGVTHQILGGELGIVVIALFAGGFWVACQFLPKQIEDQPDGKKKDIEQQDGKLNDRNVDPVKKSSSSEAQPLLSNGNATGD